MNCTFSFLVLFTGVAGIAVALLTIRTDDSTFQCSRTISVLIRRPKRSRGSRSAPRYPGEPDKRGCSIGNGSYNAAVAALHLELTDPDGGLAS
jgi:hypothetical protein